MKGKVIELTEPETNILMKENYVIIQRGEYWFFVEVLGKGTEHEYIYANLINSEVVKYR